MATVTLLFFLSSGLFLGWSLGANDAANIFGTAVASRMIKFSSAALICGIFVILGAAISGAGATQTLGQLGAINTIAGAFTVALAAAITVAFMTRLSLPVSTSQAIVGAIVGWNIFAGVDTDISVFTKIVSTWIICPLLALLFSLLLFLLTKLVLSNARIHLFKLDSYTRFGLVVVGAFGSYSLGANNISNVMGVFVSSATLREVSIGSLFNINNTQQLFIMGGVAIAIGVYTYSRKVMMTVGSGIFQLSPITALIVILASSLVLFIFASQSLHNLFLSLSLPPIPLVPVSSSQAVVGSVIGIGIAKGAHNVNYTMLVRISIGWIFTPIMAFVLSFISLFIMQNVFQNQVFI